MLYQTECVANLGDLATRRTATATDQKRIKGGKKVQFKQTSSDFQGRHQLVAFSAICSLYFAFQYRVPSQRPIIDDPSKRLAVAAAAAAASRCPIIFLHAAGQPCSTVPASCSDSKREFTKHVTWRRDLQSFDQPEELAGSLASPPIPSNNSVRELHFRWSTRIPSPSFFLKQPCLFFQLSQGPETEAPFDKPAA